MDAPSRGVSAPSGASIERAPRAPLPAERHGHWCWEGAIGTARFAFYGKATTGREPDVLAALESGGVDVATLRQIHSARVLDAAEAGERGEGDALVTHRAGLALRVVTADCVPVLLASPTALAAVHAGWRGLRDGILGSAASRLAGDGAVHAVIGPAIGGCCYEVGPEVAGAVAQRAGSPVVILQRAEGQRPHLDLRLSAALELRRAGVERISIVEACTRCEDARLWSYRRDGRRAGRNLALVWREA